MAGYRRLASAALTVENPTVPESEEQRRAMATAVGILTAWYSSSDDDPDFVSNYIHTLITEGNGEKLADVIGGLVSVAGNLLTRLRRDANQHELEVLRQLGAENAG